MPLGQPQRASEAVRRARALRARPPASEGLLKRYQFTLLISRDIAAEYAIKLRDCGIGEPIILAFLRQLALLAEIVEIKYFHFRHYPIDENDIAFLLCAMNGRATHLVSYDPHLLNLDIHYPEVDFMPSLPFLMTLRQIEPQ
jgi:predicted nucleic acid-binding protein